MENLEVIISPAAQRELKKLERRDQILVVERLETLSNNPRPIGVEKIQGHPKFYRIDAGKNHRIIYHVLNSKVVIVLVIRDRKDAYRSLGDLDGKLASALNVMEQEARLRLGAAR